MDQSESVLQLIRDMKAVASPGAQDNLARVQEGVERLTTEIEMLRMADAGPDINASLARLYGLTPKEAELLAILKGAGTNGISHDRLMTKLYSGSQKDWPADAIVKVYICKLRTKLKALKADFHIETVWGRGFVLRDGPVE